MFKHPNGKKKLEYHKFSCWDHYFFCVSPLIKCYANDIYQFLSHDISRYIFDLILQKKKNIFNLECTKQAWEAIFSKTYKKENHPPIYSDNTPVIQVLVHKNVLISS